MTDWNIQARAHACQACEKAFEDKQPYHTMLFFQEKEYLRRDVCPRCWEERFSKETAQGDGFVSYWQGVYATPPPAPAEPLEKETAESLLRKLVANEDPTYGPARYILAAMLERKRLLKVKTQIREENVRVFVYEHARTGEIFQIPDPNLDLTEWDRVRQDIARLMERGMPAAEDSAASSEQSGRAGDETPDSSDEATAVEGNKEEGG